HDPEEFRTGSDLRHKIGQSISVTGERPGLVRQIRLVTLLRLAANPVSVDIAHQRGGNPWVIVGEISEPPCALELHALGLRPPIYIHALLRRSPLSPSLQITQPPALP